MKKQIFLYGFNDKDVNLLRASMLQNKLPVCKTIASNMGNVKVGDILEGAKSEEAPNLPVDERIVLFRDLNDSELNMAIYLIRTKIKGKMPMFAMVTEHNVKWPFKALIGELSQERKYFEENGEMMSDHDEEVLETEIDEEVEAGE